MDLELQGKVALLAGGAGSIGQALAESMTREGVTAVVADLPAMLEHASGPHHTPLDVTDEASVRGAVRSVIQEHGRIDILVTLAGVYRAAPIVDISLEDWDRLMKINVAGTFLLCREVLPHMQAGDFGRIICLASLAGQVGGMVAGAHYAASKAGVLSLVKSLAKQVQRPWITVNAVNPGTVASTMVDAWPEEDRQKMRTVIPMGRFASPAEIADAICFLSSPRAAFIHGAHLDINGGAYLD